MTSDYCVVDDKQHHNDKTVCHLENEYKSWYDNFGILYGNGGNVQVIVNIQDDLDMLHELGLLNRLLEDKTTKGNIIWATDAYSDNGEQYARDAQITSDLITGENSGIIKTRARKEIEQRSERTRQHAEVFTPLWVCNRMNNDIDEVWFGAKDVFNANGAPTERVAFPEQKDWKQYVDSRRLEITCGEAPYLVSRYDVESGEMLPIPQRIGILDRKLRIVNENAANETDWIKWAIRAMQATYGYEFQGDNLLIARTNLVMTFAEYFRAWFGQEPDKPVLRKIVNIVSWNTWQMDGLTDKVPFNDQMKESISLFDFDVTENDIQHCKIYDWRRDNALKFFKLKNIKDRNTKDRKEVRSMKFDFIIGNPPYQEDRQGDSNTATPIYHCFMNEAYDLCDRVLLITPGRFLFNTGYTPKAWNEERLNDKHFKIETYYESSADVFHGVDIKGGVAISYRDKGKDFGAIEVFTNHPMLNVIFHKVIKHKSFRSLTDIMVTSFAYHFTPLVYEENPYLKGRASKGHDYDLQSNIFEIFPELFFDAVSGNKQDYIRILGRTGNQRCWKYIKRSYINQVENLDKYKLFFSKAAGTGQFGETLPDGIIGYPADGSTITFLSIGFFDSEIEVINCSKYIKTKFARTLLGVLKATQNGSKPVFKMIPIQDFTPSSDIDWSKSIREIDQQLYKKYKLTDEEIAFIESHVKEMA